MIVTNVGGLKEMCPDGKVGYVVKPNEVEIANAIDKFYIQKEESPFKNEIKKLKKAYSWSLFVEKLFSLKNKINDEY